MQVEVLPSTRTFAARLRSELRDLPDVEIAVSADTTAARAALDAVQAEAHDIHATVDVDAETAAFNAAMAEVDAEVARINGESAKVDVEAHTAAADAALLAVNAEVDRIDGRDATVDVNVDDHGSAARTGQGIGGLMTAVLALGPAVVPVAAVAVAGIGAIGIAAAAAGAGIGVLALGFSGLTDAVKKSNAAQASAGADAAAKATAIASAENQLANARRGVISAADGIRSAEEGVASARLAVQTATRQAAAGIVSALATEATAERAVQSALRESTQAQNDLISARKSAQQQLEDLAQQTKDGAISQRQGVIDVQRAKENLDRVNADPKASALDRAQAKLSYDAAKQALEDLTLRNRRLKGEKAAADKAGVNGSAQVIAAQQRVKTATDNVGLAVAAQRKAADAVTQARVDGAAAIVAAEGRVGDAQRNLLAADRQMVAAQQSIVVAQKSLTTASTAVSANAAKATAALAALSPAGAAFVGFITGKLAPALGGLKKAAQTGLLPGVQRGLEALLPFMPKVTEFVGKLAGVMGDLFEKGLKALGSPFWRQFFGYLGKTAGPIISGIATVVGDLLTGFAGLLQALVPAFAGLGGGLTSLSVKFAAWSQGLATNQGFQHFIAFVRTEGPKVMATIGSIVGALGHIIVALAPIGALAVAGLKPLADLIRAIPTPLLTVIIGLIGGLVLGIKGMLIIGRIPDMIKAVRAAWLLLGESFLVNPVFLAIAAIVVILVLVITHWDTFKRVAKAALEAVTKAAKAVWDWVKKNWPLLLAILTGPIGIAVYEIHKHWQAIKDGATAVWHWITDKFDALVGFFQGLPGRIASAASTMWNGIKDSFRAVVNGIIGLWNNLSFTIGGGEIFGKHFPSVTLDTPNIPYMAAGGIVTRPTIAMIGESGPEAVVPLSQLRVSQFTPAAASTGAAMSGGGSTEVRVFIGDQELTSLVRTEVLQHDAASARALAYGRRS